MTWNYDQQKRDWYKTETGDLLSQSKVILQRTYNAVMRHFIFQYNPYTSYMYTWKMKGTIQELELIAEDKLPIAGVGEIGKGNLQEALIEYRERGFDRTEYKEIG